MKLLETLWTAEQIVSAMKQMNRLILAAADIPEKQFFDHPVENKWSIAENIVHLNLSNKGVVKALGAPRAFLQNFGQPNGPSRPATELLSAYQKVLKKGAKAGPAFTPQLGAKPEVKELLETFQSINNRFCERLLSWEDKELEEYCIPHPVMGPFTAREMAFFVVFHMEHHHKTIQRLKKLTSPNIT